MKKKNFEVFWDGKTDTILLQTSEDSAEDWGGEFFATFCNPEVEKFLETFYNWKENALDLDKDEVTNTSFIGEYLFEETEVITGSGWFVIPASINSRKVFDFKGLKKAGFTHFDRDEFLKDIVVMWEEDETYQDFLVAITEDEKKLISLSNENPVYYIWHKDTVGKDNPDFAAILHLLAYLPEPEFENSFIYSETDDEFDFLKKVGKVCKESE